MNNDRIKESFDSYLEQSCYFVEANSFEMHCLWERYENKEHSLEIHSAGFAREVATHGGDFVTVSVNLGIYREQFILFWYVSSNVANYQKVEDYFKKKRSDIYDKRHKCDAQNFHNCTHHIDRILEPNSVNFIRES